MRKLSQFFQISVLWIFLSLIPNTHISAISVPDLGPDTTVCGGITLDAGPDFVSYQWSTSPGDTNQTVFIDFSPGQNNNLIVFVVVMDSTGASASDTIRINIEDQPVIGFTGKKEKRDSVFCHVDLTNTSTGENLDYSWDFGDGSPLILSRDASHDYIWPGSYEICLTISNSCDTITLCVDTLSFCPISPGIEKSTLETQISISPNPSEDWVLIDFGELHEEVKLSLFDLHGRILYKTKVPSAQQDRSYLLDLSSVPMGGYMVLIETENQRLIKKLVRSKQ